MDSNVKNTGTKWRMCRNALDLGSCNFKVVCV